LDDFLSDNIFSPLKNFSFTPNDNVSKDSLKILGDNFNIGDGIFNLTTEEKESLFLEDNLNIVNLIVSKLK
jgi:hypothetical protein